MKRAKILGASLGILFGTLGIAAAGFALDFKLQAINSEALLLISFFLLFAGLYGAMVGVLIQKGKPSVPFGILSSLLTTASTIIIYGLFHLIQEPGFGFSDFLGGLFTMFIYSVMLGGLPMLIIGSIFGSVMYLLLKKKK